MNVISNSVNSYQAVDIIKTQNESNINEVKISTKLSSLEVDRVNLSMAGIEKSQMEILDYQTNGAGGGDGIEPPQVLGAGGGDGIEPPQVLGAGDGDGVEPPK